MKIYGEITVSVAVKINRLSVKFYDLWRNHSLSCSENKPFVCEVCHLGFSEENEMIQHKGEHHDDIGNMIDTENEQTLATSELHYDVRKFEGDKNKMNLCVNVSSELTEEFIDVKPEADESLRSEEKLHKCDQCDKLFSCNSKLIRHMKVHNSTEKRYKCDQCKASFRRKPDLRSHYQLHSGKKPFQCDQCDKAFNTNSALTVHKYRRHSGAHKCDQCERAFQFEAALAKHFRQHMGKKAYHCDHCGKTFAHRAKFKLHLAAHSDEKPYKCNQCEKEFKYIQHLNRHLLAHTGEKPFQCDQCDKAFIQNSDF